MAEGFARRFGDDVIEVYSAGTNPTGVVSEDAIEIMKELKIDISRVQSKGLDQVPLAEMDLVVSMAPRPAHLMVPRDFRGRTADWNVEDPVGKSLTVFRRVRADLEKRVRRLVDEIRNEPRAHSR